MPKIFTKNVTLPIEDVEKLVQKWKDDKKPSQIAASFSNILELEEKHLAHFKGAPYLWKPLNGTLWGGILIDDEIKYVHLVIASPEVVQYIFDL